MAFSIEKNKVDQTVSCRQLTIEVLLPKKKYFSWAGLAIRLGLQVYIGSNTGSETLLLFYLGKVRGGTHGKRPTVQQTLPQIISGISPGEKGKISFFCASLNVIILFKM